MYTVSRDLKFEELWAELRDCYRCFELRCIAVNTDGEWRNVFFTVFLNKDDLEMVKATVNSDLNLLKRLDVLSVNGLKIFHYVSDDDINELVECIRQGYLPFGDVEVKLNQGFKNESYSGNRVIYDKRFFKLPKITWEFGSTSKSIQDNIVYRLYARGFSYGMEELGEFWLKMRDIVSLSLNGLIVFPIYFVLDELRFYEDMLRARFRIHKCLYNKVWIPCLLKRKIDEKHIMIDSFCIHDFKFISEEEGLGLYEIEHRFSKQPRDDDVLSFTVASRFGIIQHDILSIKKLKEGIYKGRLPLFREIVKKLLNSYGYDLGKSHMNVDSLELYVYYLLSHVFPVVWIGLNESLWLRIFKEYGLDSTVDFILPLGDEFILIECVQRYHTRKKGEIGKAEATKMLRLKKKLEEKGFKVTAVLICSEEYMKEYELMDGVYYIFKEGLDKMVREIGNIKKPRDLLKYAVNVTSL